MAKKSISRKKPTVLKESFGIENLRGEERDLGEVLRKFLGSPAVKYIASGIAAAYLLRLANNLSEKYPEISKFIKENMDMLEDKLSEFKGQLQHKEQFQERH